MRGAVIESGAVADWFERLCIKGNVAKGCISESRENVND